MFRRVGRPLCGLIVLAVFSTTVAWADSLVLVTSQTAQGANDSVHWLQLGADGTKLGSTATASSGAGTTVTFTLGGSDSLVSVACTASPCSWTGAGFTAGDSLIWTSDSGNGGNGPLTLSFSRGVLGVGALIQADGPAQFTAQIQALNGATPLGSFTVTSNTNGDAAYIGLLDQSGANITSVVFSLTTCSGTCTDFAIDTVNLNTAPAALVSLVSSLSPSALSQAVTFTATVKPASGTGTPTGTVTFKDGAAVLGMGMLNAGTATLITSGLGAGVHSITAVYGGDASFGSGTSPILTQTVNKGASSTSVTSSNSSSSRGANVTFTATVTSSATVTLTGTVTFLDGGTSLGTGTLSGGTATFTTSMLGIGAHSITAAYGGDANFTSSTSAILTQTIGKAASSTSVASSNNPSIIGTAVSLTATVTSSATGTPSGTVTFQDGTSALGTGTVSGGTATLTTSGLTAGTHSITAVYGGDPNFGSSTSSPALMQTVNKLASSTSVVSSNGSSIFGSAVTFTATVTSPTAGTLTGTVTFQDGAATLGTGTLSGGTATFTTSGLSGGVHSITAAYSGDANFAISTSPGLTQTVADFSFSASPATASISAGSTSTYAITITPAGGFNQTISFQCGGAPMLVTCTAPASVSSTGGSYAPFNVTVVMAATSLAPPGATVPFPGSGSRVTLEWLLALVACGILSGVATPRRSRGWQVSGFAMFVLLVCAGCGASGSGSNPAPKPGATPGTYTLTLTGTSGQLSHATMVTLTVK